MKIFSRAIHYILYVLGSFIRFIATPKNLLQGQMMSTLFFLNHKRAQQHNCRISSSLKRQFQGRILMKIAMFSSKNEVFSCFAAAYGLKNVLNVSRNTLNMFSNLKLTSSDKGLHLNTLVLMLVVILKKREKN